jgi:hypothetical protein
MRSWRGSAKKHKSCVQTIRRSIESMSLVLSSDKTAVVALRSDRLNDAGARYDPYSPGNFDPIASADCVGAYGVRRLFSKYRGPALRIRRDQDSALADVWYDASGSVSKVSEVGTTGGDEVLLDWSRIHVFKTVGSSQLTVAKACKAEVLVVGGGGGGGYDGAGGGGGGGVRHVKNVSISNGTYTATVGGGGTIATAIETKAGNGGNSSFGDISAIGGGGGGSKRATGGNGSSGGGGGHGGIYIGGQGSAGQGNAGGTSSSKRGGGGGGAGQAGQNAADTSGGAGGNGVQVSITGVGVYYGGGGGGGTFDGSTGFTSVGGLGGGGTGGRDLELNAPGQPNTGGGGGGHGRASAANNGTGGSGIVIVRIIPDFLGRDALERFLDGSAGTVVRWYDQSLTGNDVEIIRGTPRVSALDVGNHLYGTSQDGLQFPAAILPDPYTLFHVARYQSDAGSRGRIFHGPAGQGGTVTYWNGYWIHAFTYDASNDNGAGQTAHQFTLTQDVVADVLVVGGGGGGGVQNAGGGGAGGVVFSQNVLIGGSEIIRVGNGATGGPRDPHPNGARSSTFPNGKRGYDSEAFGFVAIGGGNGGGDDYWGVDGGSGGGGADDATHAGPGSGIQSSSASGGYGNDGGDGRIGGNGQAGAGGGGAGGAGKDNAPVTGIERDGGMGINFSEYFGMNFGENGWFGGGGGGAMKTSGSTGTIGKGGTGGGGIGASPNGFGENGLAGTGGGGGGGSSTNSASGGNGGSGIVLVRYPAWVSGFSGQRSGAKDVPTTNEAIVAFHFGNHDGTYGDGSRAAAARGGKIFADAVLENPRFTSNTTVDSTTYGWDTDQGWEIGQSSSNNPGILQNAFDKNNTPSGITVSTNWVSAGQPTASNPEWMSIRYPYPVTVKSYEFWARNTTDNFVRAPSKFRLQATNLSSPSESDWIDIQPEQNELSWTQNEMRTFSDINQNQSFMHYRLYITESREKDNSLGINVWCAEWRLYTVPADSGKYGSISVTNPGADQTEYQWTPPSWAAEADVLVVAGGGGGGGSEGRHRGGGGGGAGGLLYHSNFSFTTGGVSVTVGAGGIGNISTPSTDGKNSSFGLLVAIGGGAGGTGGTNLQATPGKNGGSGGGGGWQSNTTTPGGIGTLGQGYDGGISPIHPEFSNFGTNGGSGGGAGGPGAGATYTFGTVPGGTGLTFDISGINSTYAKGGDAKPFNQDITAIDELPHTGNGGHGGARDFGVDPIGRGGNGGSGIVLVRLRGDRHGSGLVVSADSGTQYRSNGVLRETLLAPATPPRLALNYDLNDPSDWVAHEVLVYNATLPDQRVLQIERNLLARYLGPSDDLPLAARTSARALYALRKVSGSYQGPTVRVRRSTDGALADLYFDPKGRLRYGKDLSSGGSGRIPGESAFWGWLADAVPFVAVWYDQSGNSRDATQSTLANQPVLTYVENAWNIEFQGASEFLSLPDDLASIETITAVSKSAQSVNAVGFILSGFTPFKGTNASAPFTTASTDDHRFFLYSGSSGARFAAGSIDNTFEADTSTPLYDEIYRVLSKDAAGNITSFLNGTQMRTRSQTTAVTPNKWRIGGIDYSFILPDGDNVYLIGVYRIFHHRSDGGFRFLVTRDANESSNTSGGSTSTDSWVWRDTIFNTLENFAYMRLDNWNFATMYQVRNMGVYDNRYYTADVEDLSGVKQVPPSNIWFNAYLYAYKSPVPTKQIREIGIFGTALSETENQTLGDSVAPQLVGALDAVSASPAAAYSLRRLFGTYTGPLVRVRRSSDNAEADVYFNDRGVVTHVSRTDLSAVLHGRKALERFQGTSTLFVTTWYDQSGSKNNAINATTSQQPFLHTLESGKRVVYFNATGQRLNMGDVDVRTLWSQFYVLQQTNGYSTLIGRAGGDRSLRFESLRVDSNAGDLFNGGDSSWYINNVGPGNATTEPTRISVSQWMHLAAVRSTSYGHLMNQIGYRSFTGANRDFNGYIFEIVTSSASLDLGSLAPLLYTRRALV